MFWFAHSDVYFYFSGCEYCCVNVLFEIFIVYFVLNAFCKQLCTLMCDWFFVSFTSVVLNVPSIKLGLFKVLCEEFNLIMVFIHLLMIKWLCYIFVSISFPLLHFWCTQTHHCFTSFNTTGNIIILYVHTACAWLKLMVRLIRNKY